jgi:cysteine desulfuration protein SufE
MPSTVVAAVNHLPCKRWSEQTMTSLQEYVESFELMDDWDQRYEYLVELGEQLPEMPEALKTEDNRVKACMSKVWISMRSENGRIKILGDCDTSVIKGVLALLINLCNGLSAQQIQQIDMDEIFQQLCLDEHLSPNRHVGVYAMFELMKQKAGEAAEAEAA